MFDEYLVITQNVNDQIEDEQKWMFQLFIYTTCIALVILIGLLYLVIRWVNKPFLTSIHSFCHFAKSGRRNLNFSLPKNRKDEFGTLFSHVGDMQNALTSTIGLVKEEALVIKSGSAEIAAGNQDLFSVQRSASALQQTAASMEEIKLAVVNNTNNAVLANSITAQTRDLAIDGASIME